MHKRHALGRWPTELFSLFSLQALIEYVVYYYTMNSETETAVNKNPLWYHKSKENRRLVLMSIILFIVAIAFALALLVVLHRKSIKLDEGVCLTPGCIHAASIVLKNLDDSVDPCDDFYQFACGRYIKETNIPEDKSSINAFDVTRELVNTQVKMIIDDSPQPGASKPYQLIRKIYDICMNTTAIEINGLPTAKSLLKDLGGWPLLEGEDWNEGKFEWKQTMYRLRKLGRGTSYFISFYVGTNIKNSTSRIIGLGEGSLGLSREYLIKGIEDDVVKAYYKYMVDEAVLFGANKDAALQEINKTLEFEISLAKLCLPREETRNMTAFYNPMTLEDVQNKYPGIPWIEYITNVLDIPDIEITEDEIVNVVVPNYINKIIDLLRRTPKRVQANHIIGKIALSTIYTLPEQFQTPQKEYFKVLYGQTETKPRWKSCTNTASGSLYLAAAASYVRRYFNENAKDRAQELVTDIRNEFIKMLKTNDWMDEDTREKALEKATSMVTYIGYPDELLEDKKIETFYLNLEINTDNYLKAMTSLSLFRTDYNFKQLREPVNKTSWITKSYPTMVNAFYNFIENSINFPAGILQGVFFGDDRPRYMNYGAIGIIIGHEITHGFDDRGRQFDAEGNLLNWWANDTLTAFTKKAQCIIDQYGNYTVPEVELNLNGINTQGETIADNGGIKEAYLAYQSWVKRNGPEQRLPGLPFNPNQMFWISAANEWCGKTRNESLKMQVTTGSHPPSRFRVLGPLRNTDFFAKDFHCPLGSSMNPIEKCHVW